jgi:hypothetical protein
MVSSAEFESSHDGLLQDNWLGHASDSYWGNSVIPLSLPGEPTIGN